MVSKGLTGAIFQGFTPRRHTPRMRGNQYAAASRFYRAVSGILDRPLSRATTTEALARVFQTANGGAFRVTSPRSCGERSLGEAQRSRAGEGLSPRARSVERALTPPSPRKGGARETRERGSTFSRHDASEFCMKLVPQEIRGRREDRVLSSHPRPVCIGRKHTVVTTGGAGSSGLPCAMVLTAYIVLSPGTGLSCPRHFRELPSRKLSASVGALGPHDFAVRESVARLATPPRPPHPAPRS